jgi:phosphoglycolate phosphatase
VRPVGVDWGYHDERELIDAGAEIVAATMGDLSGILNR